MHVTPALKPLFELELNVSGSRLVGQTPTGARRIAWVGGGRFAGPELAGTVLPGEDWITERADGAILLDVRLPLLTDAGEMILMRYRGIRHGPAAVMARLAAGEAVPAEDYYFRITPSFETAAPRLDWLNRILAVGSGRRLPEAVSYGIWQIV